MRLRNKTIMTRNPRHLYQLHPQNYKQYTVQHQIQRYHYTLQMMR